MPDAPAAWEPPLQRGTYSLTSLNLLPRLVGQVIVPVAVVDELAVGRAAGLALPDPQQD
jgi:hypothetical protein